MTKPTHTPGPWFVTNDIIIWQEDVGHIAQCRYAADAPLVAAAPELLTSLQRIMSWIDNWSPEFTDDTEFWPADRDAARAAIAKAQGD